MQSEVGRGWRGRPAWEGSSGQLVGPTEVLGLQTVVACHLALDHRNDFIQLGDFMEILGHCNGSEGASPNQEEGQIRHMMERGGLRRQGLCFAERCLF